MANLVSASKIDVHATRIQNTRKIIFIITWHSLRALNETEWGVVWFYSPKYIHALSIREIERINYNWKVSMWLMFSIKHKLSHQHWFNTIRFTILHMHGSFLFDPCPNYPFINSPNIFRFTNLLSPLVLTIFTSLETIRSRTKLLSFQLLPFSSKHS